MNRIASTCIGLLAGLVALGALAPRAHAEIGVGDKAPDFEGKDFFNCEEASLRALRGRVVLLELFSTG